MKYQFVLSLWGERYVEFFLNVTLPSLFTTGNLLGFSRYEAELDIYTLPAFSHRLATAPIVKMLSGFISVRLTRLDLTDLAAKNKYLAMSEMHRIALQRSRTIDSAMFFLAPDAILADGTLAHAREALAAGKRVIMIAGTRASTENFVNALIAEYNPRRTVALAVPPRDLVALMLRYPHEYYFGDFIWGARPYTTWPSHIYFPVVNDGFILRGFHHHPIAVYPEHRDAPLSGTVDGVWLAGAVPNRDEWLLVADSDDGYVVDALTPSTERKPVEIVDDPVKAVARWVRTETDLSHRWMAMQDIVVHSRPLSNVWDPVASQARAVIGQILGELGESAESVTRRIPFPAD